MTFGIFTKMSEKTKSISAMRMKMASRGTFGVSMRNVNITFHWKKQSEPTVSFSTGGLFMHITAISHRIALICFLVLPLYFAFCWTVLLIEILPLYIKADSGYFWKEEKYDQYHSDEKRGHGTRSRRLCPDWTRHCLCGDFNPAANTRLQCGGNANRGENNGL